MSTRQADPLCPTPAGQSMLPTKVPPSHTLRPPPSLSGVANPLGWWQGPDAWILRLCAQVPPSTEPCLPTFHFHAPRATCQQPWVGGRFRGHTPRASSSACPNSPHSAFPSRRPTGHWATSAPQGQPRAVRQPRHFIPLQGNLRPRPQGFPDYGEGKVRDKCPADSHSHPGPSMPTQRRGEAAFSLPPPVWVRPRQPPLPSLHPPLLQPLWGPVLAGQHPIQASVAGHRCPQEAEQDLAAAPGQLQDVICQCWH